MDELDRRMLTAGILPGVGEPLTGESAEEANQRIMEALFAQLNADERKAFTRLADEMLDSERTTQTCFRQKKSGRKK